MTTTDVLNPATGRVIRDGGAFLVYQFSPKVRDYIAPFFERIERDPRDNRELGFTFAPVERSGRVVFENGAMTTARPGRVLKR